METSLCIVVSAFEETDLVKNISIAALEASGTGGSNPHQ